jgi:hypothetical protein
MLKISTVLNWSLMEERVQIRHSLIPSKLPNLQNNPLVLTLPRADPAAAFQKQLEDCTLPIAIRRAGRPRIKKALDQVLFSNHFQKRHLKNKALVSSMEGSRKVKKLY